MSSIYEKAASELFDTIDPDTTSVSMSFIELSGDTCSDLLNAFTPAQLLTGQDGGVYAFPIVEPVVSTEEELVAFINHGCKVRTTAATGVNDTSSRSHAILRIYVLNNETNTEGVLTLVDLAGSEHRIDSMYHSAERRKEGAGINASLMALKEVLRAKACKKDASFYYRKSKLTMALKSSFSDPYARTVVIVTASPASKDTEHSLNSLRHACIMSGQDPTAGGETRFMTGGRTVVENIGEVDVTAIARENRANIKSGKGVDGPKTSNGNTSSFGSAVASQELTKDEENKRRLRARRSSERKAIAMLTKDQKYALQDARDQLGVNKRQQLRLRRVLQQPQPTALPQHAQESGQCYDDDGNYVDDEELTTLQSPGAGSGVKFDIVLSKKDSQQHQQPQVQHIPQQQSRHPSKPKTAAGPARKKVSKIRDMVFSDEYTPVEIKKKQFRAQLKKNGYTKDEVEHIMAKEGGSSDDSQSQGRSQPQSVTKGHRETRLAHSPIQDVCHKQTSYQATGHGRPVANSPPRQSSVQTIQNQSSIRPPLVQNSPRQPLVQNSPRQPLVRNSPRQSEGQTPPQSRWDSGGAFSSPPPEMSRAEAAKERRLQQEAAVQEARRNKIAQKSRNAAVSSTGSGDSRAIAQLEHQLNQPDITAATKHAIKKKIAAHRAVIVREERKRNQEKRSAEEALRRQQQTAKKELNFSDDATANLPPAMKQDSPGQVAPVMTNTSTIESVLSPRFKKTDARQSFSPQGNRGQTQSPAVPQPQFQQQLNDPQYQQHQQHQQHQQPMQLGNGHQPMQQYQAPYHQSSNRQQYRQPQPQQHDSYPAQYQQPQHQQHESYPAQYQQHQHQDQPTPHAQVPQRGFQQPLQSETIGDSLDSLRLNAQNVVQPPPPAASFHRGHAGAEPHATGYYRTRSQGSGKAVVSAAYSSPFATEMNYMSAKDSPY